MDRHFLNLWIGSCALLLFAGMPLTGFGQIKLEAIPPNFVNACGPDYTYLIRITNPSNTPVSNIRIDYQLPEGFEYVEGSISGLKTSEGNFRDLRIPRFSVPSLPFGLHELQFRVRATCAAAGRQGILQDQIELSFRTTVLQFAGARYNLIIPTLQLVEAVGVDTVVKVGRDVIRKYTIVNNSLGSFAELYVGAAFDPNSLTVLNLAPGEALNPENTAFVIRGELFETIGDNDQWFDPGETLELRERVQLNGCENAASSLTFSWGCQGEICTDFADLQAFVQPNADYPLLSYQITGENYAGFCTDGSLQLAFYNRGTENTPGAATAFNLKLSPAIGSILRNRDPCFTLSNFRIGAQPVQVASTPEGEYTLDLSQFTSDPDGPGGLSDLDGDGQFDDLGIGDSSRLSLDIQYRESCIVDVCNEKLRSQAFLLPAQLTTTCSPDPVAARMTGDQHNYELDISTAVRDLALEYFDGDEVEVRIRIGAGFSGFDRSCKDDSLVIRLLLPQVLKMPPNFNPRLAGQTLDYRVDGDTLTLLSDEYAGQLILNFVAECTDLSPIDLNLPCEGNAVDPIPVHNIPYWIDYFCDLQNCGEVRKILCDTTPNFVLACPNVRGTVGFNELTVQARRITMGWTDATMTARVDPATPKLNLQTAIAFDTVLIELSSTILGPGFFDSTAVRLSHFAEAYPDLLVYLADTVELVDQETNQRIVCATNGPETIFTEYDEKRYEFSLLNLLKPGGCLEGLHLTEGDEIRFRVYFMVSRQAPEAALPIPDLRANFVFTQDSIFYECGGVYTPLTIFTPSYSDRFSQLTPGVACDTLEFSFDLLQGRRRQGAADFFPFEFRPLIIWEHLDLELPYWLEYIPGSSRFQFEYREGDKATGRLSDSTTVLIDPQIVPLDSTVRLSYPSALFPGPVDAVTEQTLSSLSFKAVPACVPEEKLEIEQTLLFRTAVNNTTFESLDSIVATRTAPYEIGTRRLNSSNATFYGVTSTPAWDFELSMQGGTAPEAPNAWLYFDFSDNNIQPTILAEVDGNNTIQVLELLPAGNGQDFWVKIGSIVQDDSRRFRLEATIMDCFQGNTFFVYAYFDCNGYPDDPTQFQLNCAQEVPTLELAMQPLPSSLGIVLDESPIPPVDLCTGLTYEFHSVITESGGIFELEIITEFPESGMIYVPGSTLFSLNDNGTTFQPIADPVRLPGTNLLVWQLDNLSALPDYRPTKTNSFRVQFQVELDCDYQPTSSFTYRARWRDFCGIKDSTAVLVAPPALLPGQPPSSNNYEVVIDGLDYEVCAFENTMRIKLINLGGNPDNTSTEHEFFRLFLPEGIDFVDGSLEGIRNIPSGLDPDNRQNQEQRVLEWPLTAGLTLGDSIVFQIDLFSWDPFELPCGTVPIVLETSETITLPCGKTTTGECVINFNSNRTNFDLQLLKPDIQLQVRSAMAAVSGASSERIHLTVTYENRSIYDLDENLWLRYYYDLDQNQQWDPAIDRLIIEDLTFGTLDGETSITEEMEAFDIPADSVCFGLLLVLEVDENPCICNTVFTYLPPVKLDNINTPDDTLCVNERIQLAVEIQPGYQYEWMASPYLDNPASINPVYRYAGVFGENNLATDLLVLQTTRPGGCVSTDTLLLATSYLGVEIQILDSISCFGESDARLEAVPEGGIPEFTYLWTGLSGIDSIQDNLAPGTYSVTATDDKGCTAEGSVFIPEPTLLQVALEASDYSGYNIACFEGTNGSIQSIAEGGTPAYQYQWSDGPQTPANEGLPAGNYRLTVTDRRGCRDSVGTTLTQPPPLDWELALGEVSCFGGSDGTITVVRPQDQNFAFSLNGSGFQRDSVFFNLPAGSYTVTIRDSTNCLTEATASLETPPQQLVFAPPDVSIKYGESVELAARVHESVGDPPLWLPADSLSCSRCLVTTAAPKNTTTYRVQVISNKGCMDEDLVRVFVESPRRFFLPTAFSPNEDGINDQLVLLSNGDVRQIKTIQIFDRWNNLVYRRSNILPNDLSQGWDGTFKNKPLNSGIYVILAEIEFIDGEIQLEKGTVLLIR